MFLLTSLCMYKINKSNNSIVVGKEELKSGDQNTSINWLGKKAF